MRFKVMSYNIHSGIGTDGKPDWRRIAALIKEQNPDLLALQEVAIGHARSPQLDLFAELQAELQMHGAFGKAIAINEGRGEYGLAALSKYPCELIEKILLPTPAGHEQRISLLFHIQAPKSFYFIVSHFSYQGEFAQCEANREESARLIRQTVLKNSYQPVVWAGDFNTYWGMPTIDYIGRHWDIHNQAKPDLPTAFGSKAGWQQIDYICSAPKGNMRCLDFEVIDDLVASDHRPVCCTLEL